MSMLRTALQRAAAWCAANGVSVPADLTAALKVVGDMATISAQYHDAITQAVIDYFTGDRRIQDARGDYKHAVAQAFGDSFETGWLDGGGELPVDDDANEWLTARMEAEFGYVAILFQQMKELKKEDDKDFDYFAFATARADGYTATLRTVHAEGKVRAAGNKLLTFTGTDGSPDHICQSTNGTCVRLMGQRHRASWWVSRGLIPGPGNSNYDCGGWNCQHFLADNDGNKFTQ